MVREKVKREQPAFVPTDKPVSVRLDETGQQDLAWLGKMAGSSTSDTLRGSLAVAAALVQYGTAQLVEALRTLRDRVGENGHVTIAIDTDKDGQPLPFLIAARGAEGPIDAKNFADLQGLNLGARVSGDKVHVFAEFGLPEEPPLVMIGKQVLEIPVVRRRIGTFDWPLDRDEAFRQAVRIDLRNLDWVNPSEEA